MSASASLAPCVESRDGCVFIAASPCMLKLRSQVDLVAGLDVPVLCLGPSGSGKEVLARLIHGLSTRARATFLKVNCAALPHDLLESELFGYEAGAFTGAQRSKPGYFETCDRGTIFLDEIAEMHPSLQAKLLHVLQDHEFTRLGSCTRRKVDVRVIAATNVGITRALADRRLREDLYYRLSTVVFDLPPLRSRQEDIPVLMDYFLSKFSYQYGLPKKTISPGLLDALLRHPWRGNVRELENFAKRYLILGEELPEHPTYSTEHDGAGAVAAKAWDDAIPGAASAGNFRDLVHEAERSTIQRALLESHWNRKQAARCLQISYRVLLNKIQQLRIEEWDGVDGKRS